MPAHFSVIANPNAAAIPKQTILDAGEALKKAVRKALAKVNAAGYADDPLFQKFFCAAAKKAQAATVQAAVSKVLTAMDRFLNETSNTVTVQSKGKDAEANDYAYVWPDLGRTKETGQWFVYLGPKFSSAPLTGSGVKSVPLLTLAHEMSHHFGTNGFDPYKKEKYDGAGIALATSDPAYAAANADNYGYFIEAVGP